MTGFQITAVHVISLNKAIKSNGYILADLGIDVGGYSATGGE